MDTIPSLAIRFKVSYILSHISQSQYVVRDPQTLHSTAVAHDIHIRSHHLRKTLFFLIEHTASNL